MKRFNVVKAKGSRSDYWVERAGSLRPMAYVHLKSRAQTVCRGFNIAREHWSAKTKKDMVIVSLNLYYAANKIHVVNAIERADATEGLASVIDGIQREAYDRLAQIRLGCAG